MTTTTTRQTPPPSRPRRRRPRPRRRERRRRRPARRPRLRPPARRRRRRAAPHRPAAPLELAAGDVFVTGSSTVAPISSRVSELAGELSGGELAVVVEGPGTGDGFATFCAGDADVTDASRPINEEEVAACEEAGIEFVELEVAIDGLTVATNPANDAITCLDVPALYALVGPESEGTANWADNTRAGHRGRLGLRRCLPRPAARHQRPGRGVRHVRHVRRVRHRRPRRGAGPGRGDPRRLRVRARTTTSSSRASRARSRRSAGSATPSTRPRATA